GVFHGGFPETKALADLGALVLDGPPLPAVPGPFGWGHADLAGEEVHNDGRDLLGALGKAAFVLEELEQDGKAQARRPGLVGQQRLLTGEQGPVLDQLVGGPIVLHAALLLLGPRPLALLLASAMEVA